MDALKDESASDISLQQRTCTIKNTTANKTFVASVIKFTETG
jgi:hypothetical protein